MPGYIELAHSGNRGKSTNELNFNRLMSFAVLNFINLTHNHKCLDSKLVLLLHQVVRKVMKDIFMGIALILFAELTSFCTLTSYAVINQ